MEAGIEVHGRVGREKGEPLSALQLHKEVERAVIVGVCDDSGPSNPQINLYRNTI